MSETTVNYDGTVAAKPTVQKIVVNSSSTIFRLSPAAWKRYIELTGIDLYFIDCSTWNEVDITLPMTYEEECNFYYYVEPSLTAEINPEKLQGFEPDRTDPALVQTIEELGSKANSVYGEFQILEIPAGVKCNLVVDVEHDSEYVEEQHRTWYPK